MTDALPYASLRSVLVDGSPRARIEGTPAALAISADGRHAVVTHLAWEHGVERVTRVSLDDGRVERMATGATLPRQARRWLASGEGRIVDALPQGSSFSWRDPDGRARAVPYRQGEVVRGVTPDGAWVVLSRRGSVTTTLRAVRFDDGAERSSPAVRVAAGDFFSICDGFVAFVTSEGLARFRLDDGELRTMSLPGWSVWMVMAERGGALVACSNRQELRVYELDSLREVSRFGVTEHSLLCHFVARRLLSIEVTEREHSYVVREIDGGVAMPWRGVPHGTSAAITPDRTRAVYVRDGVLRVGDLASGHHTDLHDGPDASTCALTWSHDGALVAAVASDNTARVHDTRTGARAWSFEGHRPTGRTSLAPHARFTPDGQALLLASRLGFTLWSLSTGAELARASWPEPSADFDSVAMSPDGRLLAVASLWGSGETGVTLLDLHAEMRIAGLWALPQVIEPRRAWLRFEDPETLRWSVLSDARPGEVATYRLTLDGVVRDRARRQLRPEAKALPIEGDDRWVVVDRARISVEPMNTGGGLSGRILDGVGFVAPCDARAGLAAITARIEGATRLSLAVYDIARGRLLGLTRDARTPFGATLSPDGTRVAVRYGDGAFEVFAIDRE